MRIEKPVLGSLFGIMRLRRVMPNSDPEGRMFLSAPNNYDRLFFLHTFWSPAFDFNVGVAINDSRWRPPFWKWRRIWRRIDDKVTWPPIQPMYSQHVLLFVFISPEPKAHRWAYSICRHTSSVRHRASSVNIFKRYVLWSHEADSYQISHIASIGRGNEYM